MVENGEEIEKDVRWRGKCGMVGHCGEWWEMAGNVRGMKGWSLPSGRNISRPSKSNP